MDIREKYIQRIIEMVDENRDQNVKIAFYSDSYVSQTLEKLYERWEKNNREGIPLDYATEEELFQLAKKASLYYSNPSLIYQTDKKKKVKEESVLSKFLEIIKRLFIGTR